MALAFARGAMAMAAALAAVQAPRAEADTRKPGAPVAVRATLGAGVATVEVVFERAAERARIEIFGTDGLSLGRERVVVSERSFAAGESVRFDVPFSAPPGHSNLAIQVAGLFDGRRLTRARSLSLGQIERHGAALQSDDRGRRLKVARGVQR
jgi:hypothetical protein